MRQVSLALFGAFEVSRNGQPLTGFETLKVRALLAYLAMQAERAHTRETLATLLWPEASAELARAYLRQALANLRKVLDERTADMPTLLITRDTVQFNPGAACDLDVAAFRALLTACAHHPHRRAVACTSCARRREQAVSLYRGSFLDQFYVRDSALFEEWASLTREALHQEAVTALAQLAAYHERRGTYDALEPLARRQLALDPWREEAHQQLMRALALSGQRSAALEQYVRCRRVLASELGVEPAAETTALYERIRDTASGELSAKGDEPQHIQNFLAQTTVLIGRESELAELGALLENSACRLITIVGPGGIGKTRLALAAAAEQAEAFADGAAVVPLAGVSEPAFVASTILGALGVALRGQRDPREQLRAHLSPKELLLVLDNLEQLLVPEQFDGEGLADLLVELLQHAPGVTLLVTSRERLSLPGEWLFDLAGLRYPLGAPGQDVAVYGAIQLFVQRAQQVRRQFALAGEARAVADICRLVEGMPLAIELAAGALRGQACAAIAAALENGVAALATGRRAVPERHHSIVATFEHSWRLLSEHERQVLARLSVFRGGFNEEAAVQVAQATSEHLAALLDKSLLRWDGRARFDMHELLRQCAGEKLVQAGEAETVQRCHVEHFLALAEGMERGLSAQSQFASRLVHLSAETGNLCAALTWCEAPIGDRELGLRLAVALDLYWLYRGQVGECRHWLVGLLADEVAYAGAPPERLLRARAKALRIAGNAASDQGRMADARAFLEESTRLHLDLGEVHDAAMAQWSLAHLYWDQGALERAGALGQESLRGLRSVGDVPGVGFCLWLLSNIAREQGDLQRALTFAEANYAQAHELQLPLNIGYSLFDLSRVRLAMGDIVTARSAAEEALAIAPRVHCTLLARASLQLGRVAQAEGDTRRAATLSEQALEIARAEQRLRLQAEVLLELGWLGRRQGDEEQGVALLRKSLKLYRDCGHRGMIADCIAGLAVVYQAKAHTAADAERVERLYRAADSGYATSPGLLLQRECTGYAHELAAIRTKLGDPEGQAMTLEQAIAYALEETELQ